MTRSYTLWIAAGRILTQQVLDKEDYKACIYDAALMSDAGAQVVALVVQQHDTVHLCAISTPKECTLVQ